ncbi:MAG: hypothetical protein ABI231_08370 [Candidatus Tumulicola sp.]
MLRYFVIATIVVLGTAVVIAGWVNRDMIRIKIASVYAPVAPKPEPSSTTGRGTTVGLRGDAPWALSALPECLIQTSESTGRRSYVLEHLPAGAVAVAAPASLTYGDCTISVSGDEAYVRRGSDRFRIPPHVRFYRAPGALALLYESASGGNELRVYRPARRQLNEYQ